MRLMLRMEDVGTRQEHLTDLLDIWNGGQHILLAKSEVNHTEREKDMIRQLTFAIALLKKHMTSTVSDYREDFYLRAINSLPHNAEEIKG